jgi:aconitate hydratase 2/2-methylisocitrate dehydratase
MLKNIDEQFGKVEFKAPLVVAPPRIILLMVAEGDWEVLQNILVLNLMIMPKGVARTGYENILYLERPGCNLCMGNEKQLRRFTVMATSTSSFKEELLRMLKVKGESLLSSTPVVVLSTILRRTPTMDEYKAAVN